MDIVRAIQIQFQLVFCQRILKKRSGPLKQKSFVPAPRNQLLKVRSGSGNPCFRHKHAVDRHHVSYRAKPLNLANLKHIAAKPGLPQDRTVRRNGSDELANNAADTTDGGPDNPAIKAQLHDKQRKTWEKNRRTTR